MTLVYLTNKPLDLKKLLRYKNYFKVIVLLENIDFSWNVLIHKYFPYSNLPNYKGNCFLPLLDIKEKEFIFCEDDVFISDLALQIISNIDYTKYDIFVQNHRSIDINWWWINHQTNIPNTNKLPLCGLYNLYYIKSNVLHEIYNYYRNNKWFGHHELLLNSYLHKLSVGYFSDYIQIETSFIEIPNVVELLTNLAFMVHPVKDVQTYKLLNDYEKRI